MKEVLVALLAALRAGLRSRLSLQLEVLALPHQLAVYQRVPRTDRSCSIASDRVFGNHMWFAVPMRKAPVLHTAPDEAAHLSRQPTRTVPVGGVARGAP